MSPPLLDVHGLRMYFDTPRGTVRAIDGVSLSIERGTTLGVVGESGSGKSVLARSIMDLLPSNAVVPPGARVLFEGRDVRNLSADERKHFWGPEVAMVFQDPMTSLNPARRIGAQLTDSTRYHLGLGRRAALDRAADLLDQVQIPDPRRRLQQYPHELSGGMRQRVCIAMALSCDPKLLIADEPTTALDVTVQRQILDLLGQLQADNGMAMMLITHDLGVVAGHADRVLVMYAGQAVEQADAGALFQQVRHPYTEALLRSIPAVELPSHTRLEAIGGRPPDGARLPTGCRFAPRCRYVQPSCVEADGIPFDVTDLEHPVRCLFPVHAVADEVCAPAPAAVEQVRGAS